VRGAAVRAGSAATPRSQAAVLATLLADQSLPVPPPTPVLCFVGTELPRHQQVVGGVHLVTRKGLRKLLQGTPTELTAEQVEQVTTFLDARLKPA
jgi:hypothetical protein